MRIITTLAALAFSLAATDLIAAQPFSKEELNTKNLAQLEERARTSQDWQTLAQMWESREALLQEKAERHDRLEQRYASAPKSLIAKRGNGWNTPRRQAQMAEQARADAAVAGERASVFIARADAEAVNVD